MLPTSGPRPWPGRTASASLRQLGLAGGLSYNNWRQAQRFTQSSSENWPRLATAHARFKRQLVERAGGAILKRAAGYFAKHQK